MRHKDKTIAEHGKCPFILGLFNKTLNNSHYITSNERIIVNNELDRMWKEAVVPNLRC
jgi:hypothetical protein